MTKFTSFSRPVYGRSPRAQFPLIRPKLLLPFLISLSLIALLLIQVGLVFAQVDSQVGITKTFADGQTLITVESGAPFAYEVTYSCAAITPGANCDNATITDDLPPEVEYVSAAPFPGADIAYDSGLHRLTITFPDGIGPGQDGLNDGDTGVLLFRVRFPPGTLGGVTADNSATISADNAVPTTSGTITAQTLPGTFEMSAQKSHVDTVQAGVIDLPPSLIFQTVYNIEICSPDDIGGVNMTNPIITDTLPAVATFIDAADGGVYNSATHTVVWTHASAGGGLPDVIPVGGCYTTSLIVGFEPDGPDGAPATGDEPAAGMVATNDMTATGDPEDGSPTVTLVDGDPITLALPSYDASLAKSSDSPSSYTGRPTEELAGGPVTYTISIGNTGTVTLTNVILTDTVPVSHTVTSLNIDPAIDPVDAYFQSSDSPGLWQPFPANSYAGTTTIPVTSLGLNPGETVTAVRWHLGDIPVSGPGGSVGFTAALDPALTPGTTLQNCADMGLLALNAGTGLPETHTAQDCANVTIIDQRAIPRPGKTGSGDYLPEEVVDYNLSFSNAGVAHLPVAAPLTLADILPAELEVVVFDPGSPGADDSGYRVAVPADDWFVFTAVTNTLPAPAPTATLQTNFSGNNTLLRFEWGAPYSLAPGEALSIDFQARIKRGTAPTSLNNRAIVLWDGATISPLTCPSGDGHLLYTDALDVDGDSNTAETGCQTGDQTVNVRAFLKMESEKFVKGARDGGVWNKDGLTVPGGDVDYRMIITNASNVTATNIVAYDILPFVGDTGVVNTIPRLSDWRPNMQGLENSGGLPLTVYYSQSQNPCRPELIANGPPGCVDDWSTTPPTDFTSVQALKFEFCDVGGCLELAPDSGTGDGGALEFTWDMVAPNDAPADPQRAWNSFGFTATDVGNTLNLQPAEPNKVGIHVEYNPTGVSLGNYVWFDVAGQQNDGIQQPQEEGVNGVRVELWDPGTDNTPNTGDDVPYDLDSTPGVDYRITGPDGAGNSGYYLFYDLPDSGTYSLRFFPPTGYTASPANQTTDDLDSDGELTGVDVTYGAYLQTVPITFTPVITEDLTWDQGIWLATDYGDAPDIGYPVLASSQTPPALAARHVISDGLHLGTVVDAELDGKPNPHALGDDATDDEDGVTFGHYLGTTAQPSAIMTIGADNNVTVATTVPAGETAYLNAWIDFNGDGDWDDANEQIALNRPTTGGNINLTVAVPAGATAGTTYGRFRLSTELGLTPYYTALDGEVEDYEIQLITTPVKYLDSTSEAHTGGSSLAIGEIVRYRLEVPLPEGSMPNFTITDNLPAGLQFVDVGQVTVAYTATTSITHDPINVAGAPFGDGVDPIFELGTVVNNDNDVGEEWIIVEFNALVLNVAGNQAGSTLPNSFEVTYDTYTATSNVVNVSLVEPAASITKTAMMTPTDAGDTVVYQLVVTHDNSLTAYDVNISDLLDSNLVLQAVNVTSSPPTAVVTNNSNIGGNLVDVDLDRLASGESVTVVVTATVAANAASGRTIPNTANLTYTSLPGAGTTGNPTGSNTPSASGDPDGERNGSGGVNDYNDSDSASVVLATPTFDKQPPTPTDYTIGEQVTFNLVATLPEGTTQDLRIVDNPNAGLAYVSHQIITTAAASGGILTADYNGSLPAPTITGTGGGSGQDVTWNFGDTITTDDNNPNNNRFMIQVTMVVLDELGNQDGVSIRNRGILRYTDPTVGGTVTRTQDRYINVIEPVLAISKSIDQPFPVTAGTTITYTVVIQHAATSHHDAYDLVMSDALPTEFDPATISVVSVNAVGTAVPSTEITGGVLYVPATADTDSFDLPQGASVTIIFTADLAGGYVPGPQINNTAQLLWTPTDGPNTNERDGGNPLPDGVGLLDSGALDDYELADTVGFNLADFGDLPNPYPTIDADGGALHFLDGVTYLGAGVDADVDGQPSNGADGDDADVSGDDEDGVQFNAPLVPGTAVNIIATASTTGYLNAWFDWNNNGSLLDAGERIFTDEALTAGANSLVVNVPAGISPAALYARFRFTSAAGEATTPTGQAPDGEIEDYVLLSLGDTVWFDNGTAGGTANDGILNGGEAGIPLVDVELYRAAQTPETDTPIANVTTDGSGSYYFYGLPPGDYVVHIPAAEFGTGAALEGLASTAGAGNANANTNQDADENGVDEADPPASGISSASTTLTPGTELLANGSSNPTIDFGFVEVDWGDLPATTLLADDGARHLIDGVTYLGAGVDADVDGQPHAAALGDDGDGNDDEDGVVFLDPLVPGRSAQIQVTASADGFLNAWIDFNANGTVDAGDQIATDLALTAGVNTLTVAVPADAAGVDSIFSRFRFTSYDTAGSLSMTGVANDGEVEDYALLSLGNRVWLDSDADGVQDAGEIGIDGVIMNLLDGTGTAVTDANSQPITTTTSGGGYYTFGGLPEGSYIIEVPASNWDAGNIFGTGGAYANAMGSPGQGGDNQVNTDDNGSNDGFVATGAGMQSVAVTLTLNNEPTNEDAQETAANANSDLTIDFGVYTPVSVGNFVWLDADADGRQDSGEPGIANATVLLLDSGLNPVNDVYGHPVVSQITAVDGVYNFVNLVPGDYVVRVTPPPNHYLTSGGTDPDDDDNTDSNGAINGANIESLPVTLASRTEPAIGVDDDGTDGNNTVDFGFFQPVNLGNFVWFDANGNGIQDVGENGLATATVELLDTSLNPVNDVNGSAVISQTTAADGLYHFTDLVPGDYVVQVTPPTGYVITTGGADPDTDPDDNDSNGYDNAGAIQSPFVTLTSLGEPDTLADGDTTNGNLTVDFGFFQPVSVGNFIWLDADADGVQDGSESGLAGVQVTLLDTGFNPVNDASGAPVGAQTTLADGLYTFSNLIPGEYVVQVVPLTGYGLTGGGADPDDDDDTDSNGYDNAGDIQSLPVTLISQAEPDTLADGDDSNGNLTVDFGLVEFDRGDLPDGYATLTASNGARHVLDGVTFLGAGVDADTDGQPNTTAGGDDGDGSDDEDGVTFLHPLTPGRDAQIRVNASVPGYLNAWIDYNANGSFEAGEQIAADLALAGGDNDLTITVPGTATALDTIYARFRFTSYDPAGALGPTGQANDGEVEDYALVSIGNRVWLDSDADGLQNAGEVGIDGVLLSLSSGTGTPITDANGVIVTTTTGGGGTYNFGGLPEGSYIIEVAASNWDAGNIFGSGGTYANALGSPSQGGDDEVNSDDNGSNDGTAALGTGLSSLPINLTLGGEPSLEDPQETTANANSDLTVDFGVYTPVSVGNFVWFDANDNGVQDDGAGAGLAGADVKLLYGDGSTPVTDVNGILVAPQTTAADGLYNFSNLTPGEYIVQVTPPVNFVPTIGGADPNDDDDTDSNGYINAGYIESLPVSLSAGQEPAAGQDGDGTNGNLTVDFGFTAQRDWGDLPEGTYPTTAASDGARHIMDGLTYLGAGVDADTDGQPSAAADGDDGDGNDDEDGVSFGGAMLPGTAVNITVNASGPGYLNAWFDWGNDGALDAGDQVFTDQALAAGDNALVVNVPAGIDTSSLYARFRFTANTGEGGSSPTGIATSGEVEDYEVGIGRDWGDLPDTAVGTSPANYNTTNSDNGPSHAIDGITYLGSCVDTEADGQPNAGADGDDGNAGATSGSCAVAGDDEDGVAFVTPLIPGGVACVDVTTSAGGVLNGWIDFNGDGDFADAGEQIFSDATMSAGLNSAGSINIAETTCFNVPDPAPAIINDHAFYSRFRYTANTGEGGSSPTGAASNGEVEDYVQPLLCLGDLVWHDADDSGTVNGLEYGLNGINLNLFYDFDGDGLFEPGGDDGAVIDSTITAQAGGIDGSYSFCGLTPGGYFVQIPNTEFAAGSLLYLFGSSTASADPDVIPAVDNDDNGSDGGNAAVNGIVSTAVLNLNVDTEPTANDGDTNDQGNSDDNTNMALDFGLYRAVPMDYGDLPAGYNITALGVDGPRHTSDGLTLGTAWDADNDGQDSAGATGDDGDGGDDEDGLTIPSLGDPVWDGATADLDVTVSGDGCLNVWIDFGNGGTGDSLPDGDFDDPGEHVLVNELVTNGTTAVTINVPAWAFDPAYTGDRSPYLRARLTPRDGDNGCANAEAYAGGAASPQGLASGGEVEDYGMNFRPTAVHLQSVSANQAGNDQQTVIVFSVVFLNLVTVWSCWRRKCARSG